MPIELAHDPVLTDTEILDCYMRTPVDADNSSPYVLRVGRAIEQKVRAKMADELAKAERHGYQRAWSHAARAESHE